MRLATGRLAMRRSSAVALARPGLAFEHRRLRAWAGAPPAGATGAPPVAVERAARQTSTLRPVELLRRLERRHAIGVLPPGGAPRTPAVLRPGRARRTAFRTPAAAAPAAVRLRPAAPPLIEAAARPVPEPVAPVPPPVRIVRLLERALGRTPSAAPAPESSPAQPPPRSGEPPVRAVRLAPSIGSPLPLGARRLATLRLGFDPGAVRIHTGESAGRAARSLRAAAFTVGRHVFFAPGRFEPRTPAGLELLVHELTHVRQQPPGRGFAPRELTAAQEVALELQANGGAGGLRTASSTGRATVLPPLGLLPSNGAVVALRAPEDAPVADAASTASPAAATSAAPPPAPDARAVAEETYKLIAKRARIDRERMGVQRWR